MGRDVSALEFVEASTVSRPARQDHVFTWKERNFEIKEATYRFEVTVLGSEIGGYREGLKRGLEYFQEAIHFDPSYAVAYSGVADSYSTLGNNSILPGAEVYPKAKVAALRAVELDENLAEAHTSLATIVFRTAPASGGAMRTGDWDPCGA